MDLSQVTLGAVLPEEEARFRDLMATHHYLGAAPKVGETLWCGAVWRGEWVALASFSAAALKCQARDAWIWLDAAPQVRPAASGGQQHPVPAPAPGSQSRVPGAGAVHTPCGAGLAGTVSSSAGAAGDLRGPVAVRGHGLPCRGLDRAQHDARLPPCPENGATRVKTPQTSPHTSAVDTISRHPRSGRTPVPCQAPLRRRPQQSKNLP